MSSLSRPLFSSSLRTSLSRLYHNHPKKRDQTSTFFKFVTPYMHGMNDNKGYKVDGVSDKQYPVPMEWTRPKHIYRHQQDPEGAGDLWGLPGEGQYDLGQPRMEFAPLKEGEDLLEGAPKEVRRIVSLEFGRNRDFIRHYKNQLVKSVRQHPHDESSLEVTIASITVQIRDLQRKISELEKRGEYALGGMRNACKKKVDVRRVLLRYLRERDYKKFEWLLDELGLVYKARPFHWERIERKKHLGRLVDLWCEELKQYRLREVRKKMEKEQPKFLREKAKKLRWILEEEKKLGFESTVQESQIEECLKRAEDLEERLKSRSEEAEDEADEMKKFYVYRPEVEEEEHRILTG